MFALQFLGIGQGEQLMILELNEFKKIRIHVLTPLFIGDGTELDFTTCWIDDNSSELVEFSPEALVATLTASEISKLGYLTIDGFKNLIKQKRPEGTRIKVSLDLITKYNNNINQGFISRTTSEPNTKQPYIPGSSLKGALRTGYIASLHKSNFRNRLSNKELQAPLGGYSSDIFSTLKVSDCVSGRKVKKDILFVDRVSKHSFRAARGVEKDGFKHMVVSQVEAISSGSVFEGSISISNKTGTALHFRGIREPLQNIHEYSLSLLRDSENAIPYPQIKDLQAIQSGFANPTYLCRLGGMIGAESHTIANHRNIKINMGKGNPSINREHTTRTLFATASSKKALNNNITFGWCLIELMEREDQPSQNQALTSFLKKQHEVLFANMDEQYILPTQARQFNFVPSNPSLDRNSTYKSKVVRLSKKGGPIANILGREITVAVSSGKQYKVGDDISVTSISGTTGKESV